MLKEGLEVILRQLVIIILDVLEESFHKLLLRNILWGFYIQPSSLPDLVLGETFLQAQFVGFFCGVSIEGFFLAERFFQT